MKQDLTLNSIQIQISGAQLFLTMSSKSCTLVHNRTNFMSECPEFSNSNPRFLEPNLSKKVLVNFFKSIMAAKFGSHSA